jgi:hypothetical protein
VRAVDAAWSTDGADTGLRFCRSGCVIVEKNRCRRNGKRRAKVDEDGHYSFAVAL